MENRRTNGREAIARKLKFSQEFVMDSKLPSNPDVWTKWHEQRAGTTEMDRDLSNAPNLKYIRVSLSISFLAHLPKLLTEVKPREDIAQSSFSDIRAV